MEIATRRWSKRVSEASRILPKHRGARAYQRPCRQASYGTGSSTASSGQTGIDATGDQGVSSEPIARR
jgi:hypothetical protein